MVLYVFCAYFLKLSQFGISGKDLLLFFIIFNLVIYLLFFDKSYYHILKYGEPVTILFFMQCMLIGAWERERIEAKHRFISIRMSLPGSFLLPVIFALWKICMNRYSFCSSYQIFAQYVLLLWLFSVFELFQRWENKLPDRALILRPVSQVADITLEIYLIQFPIISYFASYVRFPMNVILCTIFIVIVAYLFHFFCEKIMTFFKLVFH